MAATFTSQTLVDGSRNTVVKINIIGDGTGELTNTVIFDASTFINPDTNNKLDRIEYTLRNFAATLYWDANTPVVLLDLVANYPSCQKFGKKYGGIINNAGTGKTGDIKITTQGLTGLPTTGEIILYIKKK